MRFSWLSSLIVKTLAKMLLAMILLFALAKYSPYLNKPPKFTNSKQ
ncbi:hypothetical protein HMPREF1433_00150 [Helicobacter pylori GAMchJs117Ai]|nr:hypothetical protein HMPREF1433_00150 [Helicobacter pylori GAMchJs117Ai]